MPLPPADAPRRVRVLGVDLSATDYNGACRSLAAWGRARLGVYVCVCNVHTVMEAHADPVYAAILNQAAMATADGMPLVWALRRLGVPGQGRVYGPDLLLAFAAFAAGQSGLSSYFYGGTSGVAAALAASLKARFPGFEVAGTEEPPFRELSPEEDEAAVARVNASGAQVCWVGLGAPKQERWMAAHAGRVRPVMVGVGAAFDFLSGRLPQAPRWMMRLGLEWLYRLGHEPRRLWRRYLLHNPHFLWHLLGELRHRRDRGGKPPG